MIFEELNGSACKTYLIGCDVTHRAMLVDPLLEHVDRYRAELARRGLALQYVLDTHVHADHVSGAAALREATGVDYVMHELSASACANVRVRDGDVLRVGEVPIRVVHTPGHTQDSVTLVLEDRILTGDFLFIGEGGAGRTDLPGGDAGEHWDALHKLAGLADTMLVYPGHDYHGRSRSTLGRERDTNPRLRPRGRTEYVAWLEGLKLGPAAWMADVIRANYACVREPGAVRLPAEQPSCEVRGTARDAGAELVRTISAEALHERLADPKPPVVVDVRRPSELGDELGHIAGVRSIPVGDLPNRIGELAGLEDVPVVTVCRSGGRSATAAAILALAGFHEVLSLEGGMARWNRLGYSVER